MTVKQGFPYKLYFDPEFDIDKPGLQYKHDSGYPEREARVQWRVDQITKTLKEGEQIRNPALVYIRKTDPTIWKLHPGKCRVRACRAMGWTTIPAIIVDKTGTYDGPGVELTAADAKAKYSDDIAVIVKPDVFITRIGKYKFKGEELHPSLEVHGQGGTIIELKAKPLNNWMPPLKIIR